MFSVQIQPDERLVVIHRQTEWVLAKTVLFIFLAVYIPSFLVIKNNLTQEFGKVLIFWIVLVFLYGLNKYLLWLLNSYVITDKRLLIVDYKSLFKKTVSDCDLGRITNLRFSTTGIFSSLLNFGNLEVTLSGLSEPFVLKNLRKPENLKTFLWSLKQAIPARE